MRLTDFIVNVLKPLVQFLIKPKKTAVGKPIKIAKIVMEIIQYIGIGP